MNDEPVAWISEYGILSKFKVNAFSQPLYTHPTEHDLGIAEAIGFDKGYQAAAAKTLTDEEIMDESFKAGLAVSKDTDVFLLEHDVEALVTFARAILRKAQEK